MEHCLFNRVNAWYNGFMVVENALLISPYNFYKKNQIDMIFIF